MNDKLRKSGIHISGDKRVKEARNQTEQHISLRLENIYPPAPEMAKLGLAEIIDARAIQSFMDDFYKLAHIPIGIIDLKGNILVGVGWQDICTRFHRVHPEACKHCVESDTKLSKGVAPGEFKLYKCKNNMWDTATPIIVGGQHVGNIFLGQFFFEGEPVDYELFRSQARKFGFNEEEYIAALEKVPRLSREAVNTIMVFFMKLANMISQLGYSNIKLSQSLAEREVLVDAVWESEERFRSVLENSLDVAYRRNLQTDVYDYMSPVVEKITGFSAQEMSTMSSNEALGLIHPEDRSLVTSGLVKAFDTGFGTLEYRFKHKDGKYLWFADHFTIIRDQNGSPLFSGGIVRDITENKKAEEALKKAHENLEELVEERTTQLEKAYNSLKESEKGLAEAQRMAHIGNWDWDIVTGEVYWSDELYHIFGRDPQESGATYDELFNYIHPEDRDYMDNVIKNALNEKLPGVDYRVILANGEERTVHTQSEVIFDEKNIPIRARGIVQDITERKRTEEKIQTLANAVESSNDAIITLSLENIITSWNKAAEQVYGYSAEEILGKDVSILESDNIKGEIKQFSEKIKQGKKIQHYETSRLKKDGTTINISAALSPIFDSTGKLVALSAIVRDITERIRAEKTLRESEARLRRFYESSILGVFYYNLDGSITDANDKLLEIVGYTREDLQGGRVKWDRMTPPEYRHLDEYAIAELKSTGMNTPYEKEYICKDGSRVPVIIGAATFDQVRNEGIAFVLDTTEKKKAEEALANIEIARKKEIHHRIKNNLQVISSLLDLQAESFSNRKYVEDSDVLNAFRESQNRVISIALIHEELHEGGGNNTLSFSPYLEKLVENLFQTYSLGNADISLSMDLEENIFFDMDTAVPLGLVVNELVSNSLKHAFPGRNKGEIQIKLFKEERFGTEKAENELGNYEEQTAGKGKGGTVYTLIVSDNGVGIPEIIDLENSDTLGLQLVNILIDQLDGEIKLKRDLGTEFRIRINV